MSLPSPTLTPPTLLGDQFQFQNVVFGYPPNSPAGLVKAEGLGKTRVRSGNTSHPRTRGSFVGLNLLDTRTITFTMDIGPPFGSYSTLAGFLAAVRTAVSTEGTAEYPLWVQVPNFPLMCCMARVVGWDPPYDVTADLGQLLKGVPLQFEATDPYFYSTPTQTATVSLPTPGVGLSFPIFGGANLSFGGASGGNQVTVTNSGDVACYPTLVITGPCLNPSVQNTSITGGPTLSFNIQLNAGDTLTIQCDTPNSVTYTPSGQSAGSDRMYTLNAGSSFFAIQPGSNAITFNSQDTSPAAGTLAVWYASAYSGLL